MFDMFFRSFIPLASMAPHSSTLAWKIPWMEEPGRLQSMGLLRVGHDWETSLWLFTFMPWRRNWQPTPVFLPGESQGWGSLVGCRLWGSHRVGHDWSDLAAAAAASLWMWFPLVVDLCSSLDNVEMIILLAIHKMKYYTTLKMIHLKKMLMASKMLHM